MTTATVAERPAASRFWVDAAWVVALFLGFTVGGWYFLTGFGLEPGSRYGDDRLMFQPAVGVAAGMGYSSLMLHAPGALDFFTGQSDTLDLTPLTDPGYFDEAVGKFDLDRVYLLTAVGLLWRITGVSWSTLWLLPSIFLGLVAVGTYGVFRLAARPWISVVGTCLALISPIVLDILPGIRDFCKGPFVLFAILFCGWMIRGVPSRTRRLAACAVMGLFIGVGVGFRQDSIICLPPMIGCVLFAPAGGRWPARLAGVAVLIGAFLIPAWPVLRMNAHSGGNNAFYLLQGFSEFSMEDLNLEPASYTPLSFHGDLNVHAAISAYADAKHFDFRDHLHRAQLSMQTRGLLLGQAYPWQPSAAVPFIAKTEPFGMWSYGAEQITRHYLTTLVTLLPGDVLTRAYGSVLRMVRGQVPQGTRSEPYNEFFSKINVVRKPLIHFLIYAGPFLFLAAFLIMAARSPWQAFLVLCITLFFLGYPSLSSQPRHVYHLYFACFWFPAFLIERALRAPAQLRPLDASKRAPEWARGFARAGGFFVVVALPMAVPLWAARLWQSQQIAALKHTYESAELEPIDFEVEPLDNGFMYYLPDTSQLFHDQNRPLTPADLLSGWRRPGIEPEYLVVELESREIPVLANVQHADQDVLLDFTSIRNFPLPALPMRLKLFVPVYGFAPTVTAYGDMPISPFKGFTFGWGTELKRVYRVKHPEDFPILMTMWLPENPDLFKDAYTLRWSPKPNWLRLFPGPFAPH